MLSHSPPRTRRCTKIKTIFFYFVVFVIFVVKFSDVAA
jgi:hypothetical protein